MLGGLFGVITKNKLANDLFFGIDYHSHLGTETGGLAFLDKDLVVVSKDISNTQFKSKFQKYYLKIKNFCGIGVLSSIKEEQPIRFESKIGIFALCTVGLIKNIEKLHSELIEGGVTFKKSREKDGKTVFNQTEIVGELISRGKNLVDGIESMYKQIDGPLSLLLLSKNEKSIYASGDIFPLIIGERKGSWAITSETSAFPNLNYKIDKFLDYREIVSISESGIKTRIKMPGKKFCPFLHVYFGFPTSEYYGINSEIVRERCGGFLAENDDVIADLVLGVADSGLAHSIGYVKRKIEIGKEKIGILLEEYKKGIIKEDELLEKIRNILKLIPPLRRPLVKYTPGWGRSYIPPIQERRELIAKYKQIPNPQIIKGKKMILVDDSIRRGTQLQNLLNEQLWPYKPKEIHGRIASPPQMYPCIFDISTQNRDLATCKSVSKINVFSNQDENEYAAMVEEIRKMIGFTSLRFQTLENLIKAVIEAPNNKGLKKEDLCLYCWTGNF